MSTKDTLIRAFMAGAILGLAAVFAITVATKTGSLLVSSVLFPVGFIMLYLMKFDLLTGVFTLVPLALIDKRPGVTIGQVMRNWGLVFVGNFAGAFTTAYDGVRSHLRIQHRRRCTRGQGCNDWRVTHPGLHGTRS